MVPTNGTAVLRSIHRDVVNLECVDEKGPFFVSLTRNPEDFTELAIQLSWQDWQLIQAALPKRDTPIVYGTLLKNAPQFTAQSGSTVHRHFERLQTSVETELIPALTTRFYILPGMLPLVLESRETLIQDKNTDPFVRRAAQILTEIEHDGNGQYDLASLVGLGIGFTPSGDDFIAGACSVEPFLTKTGTGAFTGVDRTGLERSLGRTTTGGATLLRLVLNGTPPAYIDNLLTSLFAGEAAAVIQIAARHGHSSGYDTLAGIIWRIRMHNTRMHNTRMHNKPKNGILISRDNAPNKNSG